MLVQNVTKFKTSPKRKGKMRYFEPLIGILACLWFFVASLLAGRSHRDWQHKAQALLGLFGILLFGLMLYEEVHTGSVRYLRLLSWSKAFLAGLLLGMFVTLWLEGSLNLVNEFRRRSRDGPTSDSPNA
jgi:hypothetical protein